MNARNSRRSPGEYPYPEFDNTPTDVFATPDELIRRLEKDTSQGYSIYWNVAGSDRPEQAMLFFTTDGAMIAGLGGPRTAPADALSEMQQVVNGEFGYVTSGTCPPQSTEEFISLCKHSTLPHLYHGELRSPR